MNRLYEKGVRVGYVERIDHWDNRGMPRRQRRRLAEKFYREGRISKETLKYLSQ